LIAIDAYGRKDFSNEVVHFLNGFLYVTTLDSALNAHANLNQNKVEQ